MSLTKKFLKSKPICKVTFKVSKEMAAGAKKVALVGEFNDWNLKKPIAMKGLKNGTFKTTLDLETGKSYQFRYILDGVNWENDDAADAYAPTGISNEENSIINL
jgi:1,4-alpha-glucan branching enzyme